MIQEKVNGIKKEVAPISSYGITVFFPHSEGIQKQSYS
jgi:hypothetical protein